MQKAPVSFSDTGDMLLYYNVLLIQILLQGCPYSSLAGYLLYEYFLDERIHTQRAKVASEDGLVGKDAL